LLYRDINSSSLLIFCSFHFPSILNVCMKVLSALKVLLNCRNYDMFIAWSLNTNLSISIKYNLRGSERVAKKMCIFDFQNYIHLDLTINLCSCLGKCLLHKEIHIAVARVFRPTPSRLYAPPKNIEFHFGMYYTVKILTSENKSPFFELKKI
jgi:hypothetical protein